MFSPATTAASRKRAACGVIEPIATSSSSECRLSTNLRMFTAMWRRVMLGITTCRRDPSGSIASTNGVDRSIRRPEVRSIRSTSSSTCAAVRIERGQFRAAAAGDEDPAGLVDPDLLDRRVVQERLQRPEPGDRVDGGAGGGVRIVHRREGGGADAVLVLGDHLADDLGHRARIAGRVDAAPAHQLAGPRVDDVLRRLHAKPPHPPDRTKHLLCGSVVPNLAWRASGFQPAVDGRLAGKVARSCRGVFISREAH